MGAALGIYGYEEIPALRVVWNAFAPAPKALEKGKYTSLRVVWNAFDEAPEGISQEKNTIFEGVDYFAFGEEQPGRIFAAADTSIYLLGYNGKYDDNEIYGEGWLQDYGMREYGPDWTIFPSPDPLTSKYPGLSPYQYASLNPIMNIDIDGLEGCVASGRSACYMYAKCGYCSCSFTTQANQTQIAAQTAVGVVGIIGTGVFLRYGASAAFTYYLQNPQGVNNTIGQLLNPNPTEPNLEPGIAKATEVVASQGAKSSIGATGRIGEEFLKTLGGESQVGFETALGRRVVDQLIPLAGGGKLANEAKVGYTTLTKDVATQIEKDKQLLADPTSNVKEVKWSFFESPVTGKAGASKPLLEALKKAGIKTEIIRPNDVKPQ